MKQVKLNLGCGKRQRKSYVNIDINPDCNPDLEWDLFQGIPYDDNEVDKVVAIDFLEHVPIGVTIFMIEEIHRVLKPGGIFEHFTPSTDGRGAFQDPTHQSFWNINSWYYYKAGNEMNEEYGIKAKFEILKLEDIVTSDACHIIHTFGKMKKMEHAK